MRRTCATWTLATLLWASSPPVHASEPPNANAQPPTSETPKSLPAPPPDADSRFLALKAAGDAARARGQVARATKAYLEALEIRDDPTVHGRLGLIAARARVYDAAALHLLIALRRNGGTAGEKAEFSVRFLQVRQKVCLVHFEINVQGADVDVDGRMYVAKGGYEVHFVPAGSHVARASARGYEDDSRSFDAPQGGEVTVPLFLKRPFLPLPLPSLEKRHFVSLGWSDHLFRQPTLVVAPGYAPPPTLKASAELPFRAEVALGAAVSPYGMPSVGVGGNGMMGLRWTRLALAVDIRGLITPASGIGDKQRPGRASLWTASLLPCITSSFFDICGVMNASLMTLDIDSVDLPYWDGSSVGFGGRVGARWSFAERFALVGYVETTMELRTLALRLGTDDASPREEWRSPQVRLAAGVALAVSIAP